MSKCHQIFWWNRKIPSWTIYSLNVNSLAIRWRMKERVVLEVEWENWIRNNHEQLQEITMTYYCYNSIMVCFLSLIGVCLFSLPISQIISKIESETNLVNCNGNLPHGKRKTQNRNYVVTNKSNVLMTKKAHRFKS